MAINWDKVNKYVKESEDELKSLDSRTTKKYESGGTVPQLSTGGVSSSAGWVDALFSLPGKAVDTVKNTDRQALLEKRNALETRRDNLRRSNVGGVGTFSHANDSNATRIRELDDEIASVDRFLDLQNQIELQPYEQKVTPAREELSKHSIQTNLARRSRGFTYEESKQAAKKADELRREVEKKQRGVEGIKYKQNYQDITQDSSFTGQFSANYDIGQMGEDEALAWNTYLNDPTEENRIYAESVSAAREAYMARNQEALEADTGNSWISKDLAGYLPQFLGQNIAGIKGGLGGAAAGTVLPVAGTAAGAKAGYAAGRALYGYETARGRVFKSLLDAGVPEDQARLAANDEAIVSSVIEGGDAVIDMLTLGFGNLLKKGGTAAAKSTLPKILRNYGINIGSEGLQEWTQEGVSIANQNRNDTGILNLVQESAGQMGRAISGQDPEALEQMNQAGLTGLKIAAMMGGGGIAFNTALSKATSPLMLPTADQAQETGYSRITEQDAINRFNQTVNDRPAFMPDNPLVNTLPTVSDALYYAPGSPAYRGAQTAQSAQTQQQVNTQPSAETSTQRRQGVQIPVQERTWQDAGNRKVNAFQYDHPELRPYYAEAARALKYDLASSTKGERFPIFDANSTSGKDIIGYTGTKRSVTEPIAQALDNANLSYAQIDKAIDDLIADNGQENYAAAKKLELVLDDMLTNGYTDSDGYTVPPNQEYIAARDNVNAGFSADNAEYRMSEAEFNAAVARDPAAAQLAEQLSKSFYAGDITQEEYSGAMDLMKAQLLPTVESLPTVGPESSVGAARKGFDPYSALQGKYGTIDPGENPARVVDIPKQTQDYDYVSKSVRTVAEAMVTPDEFVPEIAENVVNGNYSRLHIPYSQTVAAAEARIKNKGYTESVSDFISDVKAGKINADTITTGALLYNASVNAKDAAMTKEVLYYYILASSESGRGLSANRILKTLTPSDQLYMIQKTVNRINEEYFSQSKKKTSSSDNVPVELWMQRVGENLADELSTRTRIQKRKAKTVSDTILSDLRHFANETAPKRSQTGEVRTEMERIMDLFQNKELYNEAWNSAKSTLSDTFEGNADVLSAFEGWLDSSLNYTSRLTNELLKGADPELREMGKSGQISIREDLVDRFLSETDVEKRDAIIDEIYKNIASQIPSNFVDKFNAIRYLNMLGNLKTQIRNLGGNALMYGVRSANTKVNATLEFIASKLPKANFERTTSFFRDQDLYKLAKQDFEDVKSIATGEQKYSTTGGRNIPNSIQKYRTVFKNNGAWGTMEDSSLASKALRKGTDVAWNVLEGYRKLTSWAMEEGDVIFLKRAYADALARYLGANGVTAQEFSANNVDQSLLDRARAHAIQSAQEATFRDKNQFSDMIAHIGFKNANTPVKKIANTAIQGTMPFRRTPANVAVTSVKYSPIGILDAAWKAAKAIRGKGDINVTDVISALSKSLTGTGLFFLGKTLFEFGVLTAGEDDDEGQAALDNMQGKQAYSVIGPDGKYHSLDWAAPAAVPLFMGAELAKAEMETGLNVDSLLDAIAGSSNVLLNMSMLQSVNEQLENVSYSDYPLVDIAANAVVSYLTQGLTSTLGGQIERTFEDKRYSTYVDKNSPIPTDIQYVLGKVSAKIPGWDFQQIPYIDEWGRTESTGPLPLRAFNNFLNPAYTSQENVTPLDAEIQRIYDATGDKAVIPNRADKEITVATGVKMLLTGDEYVRYATKRGKMSFEIGSDLLNDDVFQDLTDQQKADVLDDAYSYADAMAKASISAYQPEDWITETADAGIDPATAILYKYSDAKSDAKREMLMNDPDLTSDQKKALDLALISDKSKIDYTNEQTFALSHLSDAGQEKWAKAEAWGMPYEDYVKYYPICSKSGKGMTKAVVIQNLIDAGMSQRDAYNFWDLIRNG